MKPLFHFYDHDLGLMLINIQHVRYIYGGGLSVRVAVGDNEFRESCPDKEVVFERVHSIAKMLACDITEEPPPPTNA